MKKNTILLLVIVLLLTGCKQNKKEFRIGVIQWAEHPALQDSLEGMRLGLEEKNMLKNVEIEVKNAYEDASNAMTIASQFSQKNVDVIYAIATPSAQAAKNGTSKSKIPVIFSAVSDPVEAGLLNHSNHPESHITGVSDLPPLASQIDLITEILGEQVKIGVLYNTSEVNSLNQVKLLEEIVANSETEIITKGISSANELLAASQQLAKTADTLFIQNDNMVASATGLVVEQFKRQGKPVFMAEDGQFDLGILASESVSYLELGKQAGNMIASLLLNEKTIVDMPVQIAQNTKLSINLEIAEELNIKLSRELEERADKK
ncbi:MAG TPA: ABC transporter substrate-binding protein [Erysipelothrix sp.]